MQKKEMNVKGKIVKSIYAGNIYPEKCEQVRKEFIIKDKEKTMKQIENIVLKGKVMTNYIFNYYFAEIAYDTKYYNTPCTVNEVLNNDEWLSFYITNCEAKPNLYKPDKMSLAAGVKVFMQLNTSITRMISNFSLKSAKQLLTKYSDGGVYLDPCCGWGVRMLAAAALDMEYIGFDVNKPLIDKLNELGNDIKKVKPDFKFTIYEQGSQYYVPELKNKANVILTSPPYFNLEDYNHRECEENDTITNNDYENWLKDFVAPMLKNCYNYLEDDSYCLMNVKDFNGYTLEDDFAKLGEQAGFIIASDNESYNLVKRASNNRDKITGKEKVIVLKKEKK